MPLIKPEKVLKNEKHILELVSLLVNLRQTAAKQHPEVSEDMLKWCIEQAILRTSLNDGVEFDMI